jgi:adenine-specific DNA methylase
MTQVDNNARCPHCGRWFHENHLYWHIRAKHGPNRERYHKLFVANAKRTLLRKVRS